MKNLNLLVYVAVVLIVLAIIQGITDMLFMAIYTWNITVDNGMFTFHISITVLTVLLTVILAGLLYLNRYQNRKA